MPIYASVNQGIQIAPQVDATTPATTGFKRLKSLSLVPTHGATLSEFRAMGQRFPGIQLLNDEWSGGAISGLPDYNELTYPLCGQFGQVTPVRIIPSTGLAYRWTWSLTTGTAVTPKYFTIEQGQSGGLVTRAENVAVVDLGLSWSRTDASVAGAIMGAKLKDETTDSITFTTGATDVAANMVPVAGTQVNVYVADTLVGLDSATALEKAFNYEYALNGMLVRNSGMNRATGGVDVLPGTPDGTLDLRLPINAVARAAIAKMRSGARWFVRFESQGPLIETGTPNNYYKLVIDVETAVRDAIGEPGDESGAWAYTVPLRIMEPGIRKIELTNTLATL